jgi:hypothetical protein
VLPRLAIGVVGGTALGAIARAWMRLISDDPQFTWSGTLFIVIGFAVFGLAQSIVAVVRDRATRRWSTSIARLLGTIGLMPLFVGAGALMMPTVVGGGLAAARPEWRARTRLIWFVVACGPVFVVGRQLVDDFGVSTHALAGLLMMLAIYATIVRAAQSTLAANHRGLRIPRWMKATMFTMLALLFAFFSVGVASSS